MKNFLIHLSMSLGFSVNPRLWFSTKHYKLNIGQKPQHLTKSDLATMIEQLVGEGELTHQQADRLYMQLNEYSELDLKKIIVRGQQNQDYLDHLTATTSCADEDHDHEQDLSAALHLFQDYMRTRVQ